MMKNFCSKYEGLTREFARAAVTFALLAGCTGSSSGSKIDSMFGSLSSAPVLSAVPTQVTQQNQLVKVDINNVKNSSPGDDKGMTYSCVWRPASGVATPAPCVTLPGGNATFSAGTGVFEWTPTTSDLGQYKISVTGTSSDGSDTRDFVVDVRLAFGGIESLTNVQGDRMTLNWTANPSSAGYQVLQKAADGSYSIFRTVTDPLASSITLLGLVPLTAYTWRVSAIDALGQLDGNTVSLSATTADLVRLEVSAGASALSPGQSTTVTVRLKDNAGNYLTTSGLSVGVAMSGNGTSNGTFGAVSDLGNGVYTATFTATSPGTADSITASLNQFYYVQQTALMTVRPLQVEILASQPKVNPNQDLTLTAKIRDFNGVLMSTGGQGLAFSVSGGTSTGTISAATDLGNGTFTATFRGGTAGTALTLGATLSTTSTIYATTTVTVVPYSIEITGGVSDLSVTRSTTVTARVKDWQNNYLSTGGHSLVMSVVGSSGILSIGGTTDNGNGTYTATVSGTSLGNVQVSAAMPASFQVTQAFSVTVRKLRIEILTSAAHLMPGQTATITGRVKDWQGAVIGVGGQGFDFAASAGTSSGSISPVTDQGNGNYTATFTASGAGTALTLSGSITDSYQIDTTSTITVEKWRLFVSVSAASVPTGQTITATLTVKDYLGTQATSGGQTVAFQQTGGTSTVSVGSITDNGDGTYTAPLTGVTAGTALTLSASIVQSYQVTQTAALTVGSVYLAVTVGQPQLNPGDTTYVYAQVQDSAGHALTAGTYSISFASSGGTSTGSFSSVTSLGSGLYRAQFTGSGGGSPVTITASATSAYVVASTQSIQVVPWSLEITAVATSLTVSQSTVLTGRVKNYAGHYVTTGGQGFAMSLLSTGIGSLSAVTDNSDGTYTATFMASGLGSTVVSGNVTSSYVVSVAPTLTVTPVHIAVSATQTSMNPGDGITVSAQLKDAAGVNLTSGTYTIGFAASGGTSTGTFGATLTLGLGQYTSIFTGNVAGTALAVTANASVPYVIDTTASVTVVPWNLVIAAAATNVTIIQSTTITGRIKDYQGNYLTSGGKGFVMANVTTGIGSLTAVTDNADGTYSATFTATGVGSTALTGSLTSSYTVSSAPTIIVTPVHIALSATQTSLNPNDSVTISAQLKDAAGNALLTGSYTIGFSISGGTSTGSFGTTLNLGSGLYASAFTGNVGGTTTTVSANASVAFVVDSTVSLTVVPWKLVITAGTSALTVGQSTVLTGRVRDYQGNFLATGGKSFAMSLATTGVGAISPVIDNGDGTYTSSFTASGVGSSTVAASLTSSSTVVTTPTLVVTALHIALSTAQNSLNPGDGVTITAQLKDAAGNNITTGSYTIGFTSSGGTSTGSLSSTVAVSSGVYTSVFTGNVAGTATTLTANASVPYIVDNTVGLTVVPWSITVSAAKTSYVIYETGTLTAIVRDWHGNAVTTGGKGVTLALASSGVGAISSTTDNGDGTYSANFQAASIGSVTVAANMSQSFSVASVPTLTVEKVYIKVTLGASLSSATIQSGQNVVATATLANSSGTTVTGTGYTVTFATSGGTSTASIQTGVTQVSPGVYQMTYQGVLAGTSLTVSASTSVAYQLDTTASLTVTPSHIISASQSSLAASASSVRSGQAVTVTATLKDSAGNLIPGLTGVTFANSGGTNIGSGNFSSVTDAGNGNYTASFTGTSQGTSPTTITSSYGGVTVAQTASVLVTSGAPSTLAVGGPTTVPANACSSALSFTLYDSAGNATTLASPTSFVPTGLGYGQLFSDSACANSIASVDVATGTSQSQNFYFRSYSPGNYNLNFTTGGITQSNASFTIAVGSVLSWIGAAGNVDLNGTGSTYATGTFDGTFNYTQGLSFFNAGSASYLFVNDYNNHSVQKIDITSLSAVSVKGAIGRISSAKGIPTGGTNAGYCSGLAAGSAVNGAWCTGGQYQSGSGDGQFNNPYRTTVMTIGGTNYAFITDYGNSRIMKYNADTGAFIGWTGLVSNATGINCSPSANPSAASTTPTWCTGGTSTSSGSGVAVPGAPTGGSANGGNQFRSPTYITNDGTYLYIYDSGNNRIVKLDPTTGLLVHWMGRVASSVVGGASGTASPTAITCLTNTQSDGSSTVADGQWTPSWCSGGSSVSTAISIGGGTNVNLNAQSQAARAMTFYSDGTYNWMLVADSGLHRMARYLCGPSSATPNCAGTSAVTIGGTSYYPGQFFGWTGYVSTTATNAATIPSAITSLFNATSGGATSVTTNGWAYYGGSSAYNSSGNGGIYNPFGVTINGTTAYVANTNDFRVERLNLLTGAFTGWIGRISSTPSGGVSGCAGANAGSVTPGWCLGGTGTQGSALGAFGNTMDIANDGTNLYVADRDNYRVTIHNLVTGAAVGAIGLRVNSQPNTWSNLPYALSTAMPTSTSLSTWSTNRDRVFNNPDSATINGSYLYVSDASSHRIKRYNWLDGSFQGWIGLTSSYSPTGGDANCVGALTGGFTPGWCQGGGFTSTNSFGYNTPRGLASDGTYLYVADSGNHRIVRNRLSDGAFTGWIGYISSQPSDGDSGCANASVGTATPGWCLGGTSTSSAGYVLGGFNAPNGLAGFTDTDGKYYLIVGDSSNNRLQKIDVSNPANVSWVGVNNSGATKCGAASGTMVMSWCATSGVTTGNGNTTSFLENGYFSGNRAVVVDTSTSPYYIYATSSSGRVLRFNATTGAFGGWIGSFGTTITNSACDSGTATANTVTPSWCHGGNVTGGTGNGQFSGSIAGLYSDGTYLYASDTPNFRIHKFNRATGTYVGWIGRVQNPTGLGGGPGCSSLAAGDITPTWCTGGTSKGGYLLDLTNKRAAFDTPQGITGMGSYIYVLDAANGRILSMPSN